MSVNTDYQNGGDTITKPKETALNGYYRDFAGLWTHTNSHMAHAVTIDHVVIAHGEVWCEVNGTAIEAIIQGKLP